MSSQLEYLNRKRMPNRVFSFRVPNDLAAEILKRAGEQGHESVSAYCAIVVERDVKGKSKGLEEYAPDDNYAELYTRAQEAIEGLTDYRDFLQGKMMAMAEVMREQTEELKRLKKESDNRLFGFDVKTDFQQFATGDDVHTRDDGNERDTDWMSTDEIMDNLTK
jgi:hypothetical protein